jgi:hypothetical protein
MRPQSLLRARRPLAVLGALCLIIILAAGASARAQDPTPTDASTPPAAPTATVVKPLVRAHPLRDVLAGRTTRGRGRISPAAAGIPVALQALLGGRWRTLDRARTDASGAYALRFRTHRPGSWPARVRVGATPASAPAVRSLGRLDVFRTAFVSWYGPGLYGQHLACGGTLTPSTLGVANKALPCGTKVTLHLGRRTVRVPVVDRGPYVGGREYDLTAATKARLGFGSTGTVWVTR